MDNIIISTIGVSSPKYQQVYDLRETVLRIPLGLSLKNEDLSRDLVNTIFIAEQEGHVIGCVLMQEIDIDNVQLRAMAVYDDWQGKGIGRLLVTALEKLAAEQGYKRIELHSRDVAKGFYLSLGYNTCSDEFTEVGIRHVMMEKPLTGNP